MAQPLMHAAVFDNRNCRMGRCLSQYPLKPFFCLLDGCDEEEVTSPVAFIDEIPKRFTLIAGEVTDDCHLQAIVDELLKNIACDPCA